jgi:hypothetical protein
MRAAEHAPRDPRHLLERRHGFAEIVERGGWVQDGRHRIKPRVVGARLDGLRDGLLVFFVGVVLFCVTAAVDPFTNLLVAAAPVVMLASGVAVSRMTSNTSRRVVGQWGGAGGASCEDHFGVA